MPVIRYCSACHVYCTQSLGVPGPGCERGYAEECVKRFQGIVKKERYVEGVVVGHDIPVQPEQ